MIRETLLKRALAMANEQIARRSNGDGETKSSRPALDAWKARLEAAGMQARYTHSYCNVFWIQWGETLPSSVNRYQAEAAGEREAVRVLAIVDPADSDDNATRHRNECTEMATWPTGWDDDAVRDFSRGFFTRIRA